MKVCKNCGKQYEDIVAFCVACGCTVEPFVEEAPAGEAVAAPAEKKSSSVLYFISNLITIISAFFAAVAVALPDINVNVNLSSYSYKLYAYAYAYPETTCAIFALILAIPAFLTAVVSLVLTASQHLGTEKTLSRVTKMVCNLFLLVFAIILVANI